MAFVDSRFRGCSPLCRSSVFEKQGLITETGVFAFLFVRLSDLKRVLICSVVELNNVGSSQTVELFVGPTALAEMRFASAPVPEPFCDSRFTSYSTVSHPFISINFDVSRCAEKPESGGLRKERNASGIF